MTSFANENADSSDSCILCAFLRLLGPGTATDRTFFEKRYPSCRRDDHVCPGVQGSIKRGVDGCFTTIAEPATA